MDVDLTWRAYQTLWLSKARPPEDEEENDVEENDEEDEDEDYEDEEEGCSPRASHIDEI